MNPLRRINLGIASLMSQQLDLILLWAALVVAQPLVPITSPLGRTDLLPWMVLTLCAVTLLRGRVHGAGSHPMLTPRRSALSWWVRRVAQVITPAAMFALYDGLLQGALLWILGGVAGGLLVMALVGWSSDHGETAWNPPGTPDWLWWGFGLVLNGGAVFGLAALSELGELEEYVGESMLIGLGFLTVGLIDGQPRNLRQRYAAGQRDGSRYRLDLFPFALALLGPGLGLLAAAVVFKSLGGVDFTQAYIGSLYIVAWGAVLWPKPDPIARACLLHEVLPTGGSDPNVKGAAQGFDQPPEGSLRFNPLRTRRNRVVHPWLVPVRASRIAELDDPVRPLWTRGVPPLPFHLLGEASFEPDPDTRNTQSEVITVRLQGSGDVQEVEGGGDSAQQKRLVVLRAFPAPGTSRKVRPATYRWEEPVPEQTVQIIDDTTDRVFLRDGDIIVISAEGVARAYEVEIGSALFNAFDAQMFRPPQLEDYSKGA